MNTNVGDEVAARTADLIALQDVKRWGVMALTRQQSVAEHSYNVAVITMELIDRLELADHTEEYINWALLHDGPECISADIDGRFKRENPDLKKEIVRAENRMLPWYRKAASYVPTHVNAVVKLADQIETYWYIQRFGIGHRSVAVANEQIRLIWEQRVQAVAKELDNPATGLELVRRVTEDIIARLATESHNIQMRLDAARV